MTLTYDDYNQVYVWVDVDDHDRTMSPHFDYEEDAVQWYGRISKHIFDEYGINKDSE